MNREPIVFANIRNLKITTKYDGDGKPYTSLSFTVGTKPQDIATLIEWFAERPIVLTITSPQLSFGETTDVIDHETEVKIMGAL